VTETNCGPKHAQFRVHFSVDQISELVRPGRDRYRVTAPANVEVEPEEAESEEAPASAHNSRRCRHCGESFQYPSWLTRHYTKCPERPAAERLREPAASAAAAAAAADAAGEAESSPLQLAQRQLTQRAAAATAAAAGSALGFACKACAAPAVAGGFGYCRAHTVRAALCDHNRSALFSLLKC
jgi:hypothetical protein